MEDLEINNQKDFYEEVRLDTNGNLVTTAVTQSGALTAANTAREFYERIALDENGELKIII